MQPLEHKEVNSKVPDVTFPIRENDNWGNITSNHIFDKKNYNVVNHEIKTDTTFNQQLNNSLKTQIIH